MFTTEVTRDVCEKYAQNRFTMVPKKEALACERSFPDEFVADFVGRRSVRLWHIEYTWSRLWKNFIR